MDPAVDQDDPVARDTMEHSKQAVARKNAWRNNFNTEIHHRRYYAPAIQEPNIKPTTARIKIACMVLLIAARMPASM